MKENCFDEGVMQAFLDGELSTDMLEKVARHVALCDLCALILQETEEESAFAFAALDNEFNTLVPTERIRTNLYQAISEMEKPSISFWQRILSFGAFLSNPSVAALASLLIIATVLAAIVSFRNESSSETVTGSLVSQANLPKETGPVMQTSGEQVFPVDNPPALTTQVTSKPRGENQPKFENAVYRVPAPGRTTSNVSKSQPTESVAGEETYVKTIASLTETVNAQKDTVLKPAARVDFEKNMAIVNGTIAKMKKEVRKNPKNEAAKEVLKNSYQNKIDLLSSVSEKNELMAALKD